MPEKIPTANSLMSMGESSTEDEETEESGEEIIPSQVTPERTRLRAKRLKQ